MRHHPDAERIMLDGGDGRPGAVLPRPDLRLIQAVKDQRSGFGGPPAEGTRGCGTRDMATVPPPWLGRLTTTIPSLRTG